MSSKRRIEIFSVECAACDEAVAMVRRIACWSCEVEVLDAWFLDRSWNAPPTYGDAGG